jgi:Secretion system C-terminal sorting domain
MKKIIALTSIFILLLFNYSKGDVIGACTVPAPTYGVTNIFSIYNNPISSACLPPGIVGSTANSKWELTGSTPSSLSIKVIYSLFSGTSISSGANLIGRFYSTTAYAPGTSIIGTYVINDLTPVPAFLSSLISVTNNYFIVASLGFTCTDPGNSTIKGFGAGYSSGSTLLTLNADHNLNSFKVNNSAQTSSTPAVLNILDEDNIIMDNFVTASFSNYQIIVEKGSSAISFPGGAATFTGPVITSTTLPAFFNLADLCPLTFFTAVPTPFLRVSLKVTNSIGSGCNAAGVYTKTQVYQVNNIANAIGLNLNAGNTCGSIQKGLLLANTTQARFNSARFGPMPATQTALCSALGWQGATTCGVSRVANIPASAPWSIKVYEASSTDGKKLANAPILVNYNSATNFTNGPFLPTSLANTLQFNTLTTFGPGSLAPFYTGPGNQYFTGYYTLARFGAAGTILNYSSKIYCVELNVTLPVGIAIKRTYFRIANDGGAGLAGSWKTDIAQENLDQPKLSNNLIEITPNPASSFLLLKFKEIVNPEYFNIYNTQGLLVLSNKINAEYSTINIESLNEGIYFYTLTMSKEVIQGKFLKQ